MDFPLPPPLAGLPKIGFRQLHADFRDRPFLFGHSPQRGGTPKPGVDALAAHPGLAWHMDAGAPGSRHPEGVLQDHHDLALLRNTERGLPFRSGRGGHDTAFCQTDRGFGGAGRNHNN